ncbi:MAG TPA: FAD-dependent oxidoreductase [Bryobacteraceae bacterium]|jgi:glycine/D-amino acid oxidase-like deaminating enzyme|nr:FAD-dependent oxidoreductase [Bryobacteraceae bacterium]
MIARRRFLSAALIGLTVKAERRIPGGFVNDSFPLGHRLRDHAKFQTAARQEKYPVVIIGGGMAGLSAAWRLLKRNFHDFVLLEMEPQPGGNSRWGENEITAYPWAAHYVPVPGPRAALVRELFEDLGVLRDGVWDERRLCFAPQERLFIHGRWQEGIEPEADSTSRDREDYRRFQDMVNEFRATGQFTIPMRLGARESELDRLSMQEWLARNRFTSPYLSWYVNYACRDDYGALARDTSAWAGIHYFASREPEEKGPLTWPEGNGWIVRRLMERLQRYIRVNTPVYSIVREGTRLRIRSEQADFIAEKVIFAAPTFLAPYLIEGAPRVDFVYSPWLTANLTIEHSPEDVAWDNVIYDSPALGYVDAMHMSLKTFIDRSVWTFYWSLCDRPPADARALLLEKDWTYWREAILNDLSRAHPDIRRRVSRIDIMRIGHAMSRPVPGFLKSRLDFKNRGPIFFANSDLSGFSIFEEAQEHGIKAADRALASGV